MMTQLKGTCLASFGAEVLASQHLFDLTVPRTALHCTATLTPTVRAQ